MLSTIALVAQLTAVAPVLAFPDPALDDPARYQGYTTRFYRDASRNTVQVYLDQRSGRVVHVWADDDNESLAFTARNADRPAELLWGRTNATVARRGRFRTLAYALSTTARRIDLGHFVLGTMRIERDFQYFQRHTEPFDAPRFQADEFGQLISALERLPALTRRDHLQLLNATDVATLRARLTPRLSERVSGNDWRATILQPSLDGRDTLLLHLSADRRRTRGKANASVVTLERIAGDSLHVTVEVATTGRALTPLTRNEIFTDEFLAFLAAARDSGRKSGGAAATRAGWLERQVRGVELLSSREKLMAGMPTYATYFGRDMLLSALMLQPIWRAPMSEFAIGAALRKLSATGQVSHEEAVGEQASREAAREYALLVDSALAADSARARPLMARATEVLRAHRRVRENYHMIDDELQLPILVARWLADPRRPAAAKRAFLQGSEHGTGRTRLSLLLQEFAVVAQMTAAYTRAPLPRNLIPFARRDSITNASSSWRDSGAGYGNGRYAMDVNAIWAPFALDAISQSLDALTALGYRPETLLRGAGESVVEALGAYVRDRPLLRGAIAVWRGAARHFEVRLTPEQVRERVGARLTTLPAAEREFWLGAMRSNAAPTDTLVFRALALDDNARPIGLLSTDPMTRLFLTTPDVISPVEMQLVLRETDHLVRGYPVGLFVDGVGPVVVNDAYATPAVWRAFDRDAYHGPRVVWGREVHLALAGIAAHIAAAEAAAPTPERTAYSATLRSALTRLTAAGEAAGFRSELWSYEFRNGRPHAVRYGTSGDIQLWSTTDLAVQWTLSRLSRKP